MPAEKKVATYGTDATDDHIISRKGMKDMNGPLDPLHECAIVPERSTQRLGLLLKGIDDRIDGFTGYELGEDLMLDQVCPCSLLEFIQSRFKERSQLSRGLDRHGVESVCLVVEDSWEDCGRCNTADGRPDTRPWRVAN